jgi:serine/threonine-protein kinase
LDTLIGTTLGGYELTRAIGSGGMGTVYLAEDQSVGQQVAIKIVRTEYDDFADMFSKEEAVERFKQEARAIATLDHLHILPLYRYGEEKVSNTMRAYMVMQYRPEGSLWDWLRKRAGKKLGEQPQMSDPGIVAPLPAGLPTSWPLSVTEAADYLQQASSALQYAHDHGIVHRDVKPANFLLRFDSNYTTNTTKAFLLLSDFGLAKFFASGTATSFALGTPMYMAPEQFYSSAGPASDQYALAVMIYYILAGHAPFTGDPARMMHQHLNVAPPPIRTFVPDLSPGVEAVLNRALAKQIQDRYPRVEAFAEDFRQRINDKTLGTYTPFKPHTLANNRPIAPTIVASSAAPVMSPGTPWPQMGSYAGGQAPISTGPDPVAMVHTPASLPPTLFPSPSGNPAPLARPSWPPTQNRGQEAGMPQWGQMPASVESPMGPPPPDNRLQTDTGKNKVSRRKAVGWLVSGGIVVGIGTVAGVLVYTNGHRQQDKKTQTTQGTQGITARASLVGHSDEVRSISWSPDGDRLASGSLDTTVRVWDIAKQQTSLIYPGHKQGVGAVAWNQNPQVKLIASGGRDELVRIWDSLTGANQIITPNLSNEVSSLAWAPDAGSVFVGTLGAGLHKITVDEQQVTRIGPKTQINALASSPDGNYLALGLKSGAVTVSSLIDKSLPVLLNLQKSVFGLAWSPDSGLLAIGGNDQKVDLLDIATRKIVQSKTLNSSVNGVSWAPDNSHRLAIAQADGTVSIWNTINDTLISGTRHNGPVITVAWGSQHLASGSADKTITIWNV